MDKPADRRPMIRAAALTAVGVAVGVWLFKSISWSDVAEALSRLEIAHLLVGFGLYIVFLVFKAARFGALLQLRRSGRRLFGVVCAQTFWSNFLPMRTGDLSYVVMMARRPDIGSSRAVASLVVAGILDLWWTLLLAGAVGTYLWAAGAAGGAVKALTLIVFVGLLAIAVALWISRVVPELRLHKAVRSIERVPVVGPWVGRVVRDIRKQGWSRHFALGSLFSAATLGLRYAFQVYLLTAMFEEISVLQGLYALAFAGVVNMLPIQGFANVGSIELPWAWAAQSSGVAAETAIAAAFALHGVVLGYAIVAGVLSVLVLGLRPARRAD